MDIKKYISDSELCYYKNELQCVSLLLTGNEISNGYYDHFINQISGSSTDSLIISSQIDFKFITTSDVDFNYNFISKYFKSVEIIKLYIPKYLDVYYNSEHECINGVPTLGLKSGPNYIFFQAIKELYKYNTTLFLECDISLKNDWLHNIYHYINNVNSFWISGSKYDGINTMDINHILNTHINGGVAIYATGNMVFQKFMKFCYDCFPYYIKQKTSNLPYDFLIKMIIDDNFNKREINDIIWQFINRQYLINNHIFNYSVAKDASIENEYIDKLYNYSIVHKKPFIETDNKFYKKYLTNNSLYEHLSKTR